MRHDKENASKLSAITLFYQSLRSKMDSKTSCFVFPLTTSLTFYQFGKYSIAVPCDNGKLGTI